MLMQIPSRGRVHILLVLSALVVAYVRAKLQYDRYGWDSLEGLVSSWVIHYLALGILAAVCSVVISSSSAYLFPQDTEQNDLSMDRAVFHVAVIAMIAAIAIFLLAHNVISDSYGI